MSASESVTLRLSAELAQRLREAVAETDMTLDDLAEAALAQKVLELEIERIRGVVYEEEIRRALPSLGEEVPLDDEALPALPDVHRCELCNTAFIKPMSEVEGPIFCDNCIEIARGGNFEPIEQEESPL